MSDNPTYFQRGLFLTADEYDIVSTAMTLMIETIKNHHPEQLERINPIARLMVRLHHTVQAGAGMTPEVAERYTGRIRRAMQSGNPGAIKNSIAALLEAGLRLDPDPAEFVAKLAIEQVGDSASAMGQALMTRWLGGLLDVLQGAKSDWEGSGYPHGSEVLAWVVDAVEAGREDVAAGHEPWASEAPSEADKAAADEVAPSE